MYNSYIVVINLQLQMRASCVFSYLHRIYKCLHIFAINMSDIYIYILFPDSL